MKNKGFIGGIVLAVALVIGLICGLMCIEKVPVGYEGVVYSMAGGVQEETLSQGWHLVAPNKKVNLFTVANEQLVLTKDSRDGSEGDESFNVSTADDASISISFQMSYRYVPADLVSTYKKFKGMDGERIVNSRVRTVLKSKISEVTTDYSMMDIYSGNRSKINNEITKCLNDAFKKEYGIEVISASIVDVHPDERLQKTIEDRVTALQKKQQAQAEQETAKVEAETKKIKAQADADAMIIAAQAEADAYRIKSAEITDALLKKWELDARAKHGWVTIQGGTPIVNAQ
jgi:regulator of protease activity HflC (stomatin/prohibitin superfamily)